MRKKNILFFITSYGIGGTNRSLQNLLNKIDVNKYDIYLYVLSKRGDYEDKFLNCKVLANNYIIDLIISHLSDLHGFVKILSSVFKILCKLTKYRFLDWLYKNECKKLNKRLSYEAVVAYSEGVCTKFVSFFEHPNKIAWIHCDYASYFQLNHGINELSIYNSYKHIVCVSDYTRSSFVSIYPSLNERTISIWNILDIDMMKELSGESQDVSFNKEVFNIVSIGRLNPVKRLSIIPQIAFQLKKYNLDFNWYIIGPIPSDKSEYYKLIQDIETFKLQNCVRYIGERSNPYNYIKNANLLVNTSISEACPYVINEAKILHTPVICTDFGSAPEFIEQGKNGFYVPVDSIQRKIIDLIKDKLLYNKMKNSLSNFEYDNSYLLNKIYELLE